MSDIVQRLRESVTQCRALDRAALLNEAADEITKIRREVADLRGTADKLRSRLRLADAALRSDSPTLTDAERSAIADAADRYAEITPESAETAATLRGLLERMK